MRLSHYFASCRGDGLGGALPGVMQGDHARLPPKLPRLKVLRTKVVTRALLDAKLRHWRNPGRWQRKVMHYIKQLLKKLLSQLNTDYFLIGGTPLVLALMLSRMLGILLPNYFWRGLFSISVFTLPSLKMTTISKWFWALNSISAILLPLPTSLHGPISVVRG